MASRNAGPSKEVRRPVMSTRETASAWRICTVKFTWSSHSWEFDFTPNQEGKGERNFVAKNENQFQGLSPRPVLRFAAWLKTVLSPRPFVKCLVAFIGGT